jgi:hypothetical protein
MGNDKTEVIKMKKIIFAFIISIMVIPHYTEAARPKEIILMNAES